jgi:Exocyst complex component Sec8 N-terminal
MSTHLQFNPVILALALLDESSAGRDFDSFRQTKQLLATTLKGSVDSKFEWLVTASNPFFDRFY